jgi:hypothetical protein
VCLLLFGGCSDSQIQPKESPAEGAARLFKEEYDSKAARTDPEQQISIEPIRGATCGEPQPMLADWEGPGSLPGSWVLYEDAKAADSGMFRAMQPARVSTQGYFVPAVRDGRIVGEFEMALGEDGRWVNANGALYAGGILGFMEKASLELRAALGPDTEVRTAMFLPSGLVFSVGHAHGRELAAFLGFTNIEDNGVEGFDKALPSIGQIFTPQELKDLLTP